MTIGEVAERYELTNREITYLIEKGMLHPKQNKENNWREFDDECIDELRMIRIMKILGMKCDKEHMDVLRILPDDWWEITITPSLINAKARQTEIMDDLIRFSKERKNK